MTYQFTLLMFSISCLFSCRPTAPEEIPLPTKICVLTTHHVQYIQHAKVWVKYNVDTFPGYNQPSNYFDASFETGADAHGCLEPVPEGRHWLIASGYDGFAQVPVYGSMQVVISVRNKPVVDTILYVSE
jgi:hypothetical protein